MLILKYVFIVLAKKMHLSLLVTDAGVTRVIPNATARLKNQLNRLFNVMNSRTFVRYIANSNVLPNWVARTKWTENSKLHLKKRQHQTVLNKLKEANGSQITWISNGKGAVQCCCRMKPYC